MEREVPVVRHRGTVAELHALDPFVPERRVTAGPTVWWCDPVDAAIVLGSRQTDALLDRAAVERADLSVVRRRSGGGAVIVHPGVVWLDLVVPSSAAPDLVADVRRSMVWAGERWRTALVDVGLPPGRLTVHTGALVETAWSSLVCFAGVGPGEVLLDDRKLVGLSQRRTRRGARIQGQLHRSGATGAVADLFVPPRPAEPPTDAAVWPVPATARVAAALARRVAEAGSVPS